VDRRGLRRLRFRSVPGAARARKRLVWTNRVTPIPIARLGGDMFEEAGLLELRGEPNQARVVAHRCNELNADPQARRISAQRQ
jgi:hypothetical protein